MSAYVAVVSLKKNLEGLKNPGFDPKIRESAYKTFGDLKFCLRSFDRQTHRTFDRVAIGAVEAKIRDAAWRLEDALDSVGYLPSPINGGVEEEIHSFIETAIILMEEHRILYCKPLDDEEENKAEDEDEDGDPGGKTTTVGLSDGQPEKIIKELTDAEDGLKIVTLVGMAGIGKSHLARLIYQHPQIVQHFDIRVWVRVGQKGRLHEISNNITAELERKVRDLCGDDGTIWDTDRPLSIWDTDRPLIMRRRWNYLRYFLSRQRCLIVLDDTWERQEILYFLIDLQRVGVRRILRTSRIHTESKMHKNHNHHVQFLNSEDSWNLLWQNVFMDESSFPNELEKVGRKIAEMCEGLPLLILTVADILRGMDKTEEYWNKVANMKTSTFVDAYESISKVLMSSYDYLKEDLRAFFLYMGVFPPRYKISVSKLMNLCYVENFLQPILHSNSQIYFRECLEQLVHSSIVIACKQSYDDKRIKSCKLHSAYWYLCIQKSSKNKFFHVLNTLTDCSEESIEGQRRLSVQNNVLFGLEKARASIDAAGTKARSLLCTGKYHEYPVRVCLDLMFLKVLDALSLRFYEFPKEVVKLLLLRYLALTHNGPLPSSISNLEGLEFLIVRQHHNVKVLKNPTFLPTEIWEMQQLRHLEITGHILQGPSNAEELLNLVTLYVNPHSCTEGVFSGVRNLKKLVIRIDLQPDDNAAETMHCFEHIELLNELESLKCVVANPWSWMGSDIVAPPSLLPDLPECLKKLSLSGLGYSNPWSWMWSDIVARPHQLPTLPRCLKKLSLSGLGYSNPWSWMWYDIVARPCRLPSLPRCLKKLSLSGLGYSWQHMATIGSLPKLEVLKLRCSAFRGAKWEVSAGEFRRLEYLVLDDLDLVEWTAVAADDDDGDCLPRLRSLRIRDCYKLKEIPESIFLLLRSMEVIDCNATFMNLALKMDKLVPTLQVVIGSSWKDD